MKDQIDAILSGVKDKAVNKVGPYWQIRVGTRAGARENGVSLARELLKQYSEDVTPPAAPATDYEAIIADLKAQLAAKPAFEPHTEPATVEMPAFLHAPPPEVADMLEDLGLHPSDSYERVNTALVAKLTEAKGSAELARTYGGAFNGKSVVEWERKSQSINESIRWNSGRKIEMI
jgi:hypothetical protein